MQALTAASGTLGAKYLIDCTIYVTVEPCVMCAVLCRGQKFRDWYGASEPKFGYTESPYSPTS